jgi:hypothetical protein
MALTGSAIARDRSFRFRGISIAPRARLSPSLFALGGVSPPPPLGSPPSHRESKAKNIVGVQRRCRALKLDIRATTINP